MSHFAIDAEMSGWRFVALVSGRSCGASMLNWQLCPEAATYGLSIGELCWRKSQSEGLGFSAVRYQSDFRSSD
jgi:hypothetical protein